MPAFQRWVREAEAERASRPIAAHIGVPFAGELQARVPEGPCFAVIFSSQRQAGADDYAAAAERMDALARTMPGFLDVMSARGPDGFGITVSYWSSLDAIAGFRAHAEHVPVQHAGRERFYATYDLRVARVERRTLFDAAKSPARVEPYV